MVHSLWRNTSTPPKVADWVSSMASGHCCTCTTQSGILVPCKSAENMTTVESCFTVALYSHAGKPARGSNYTNLCKTYALLLIMNTGNHTTITWYSQRSPHEIRKEVTWLSHSRQVTTHLFYHLLKILLLLLPEFAVVLHWGDVGGRTWSWVRVVWRGRSGWPYRYRGSSGVRKGKNGG